MDQSKKTINYLEELYKHLILLNDNFYNKEIDYTVLIELGVIDKTEQLDELIKLIEKKCSFSAKDFLNNINKIHHDDSDKLCLVPLYCKKCRNVIKEKEEKLKKPTLIDLFCGAGGMSLGFKQAGYKIIYANDVDESCIQTYKFNHPEVDPNNVILGDVEEHGDEILNRIGNQEVDIVIGGPPCQGFSTANRQRVIDDPRNRLYKEYVKVVSKLQPSFFVMENVIGMKNKADQIIEDFNSIGYNVEYEILNAKDFSVPQNRRRIIFIGNRHGINNQSIFNEITENNKNGEQFNLKDAIGDLRELEPSRVKYATEVDCEDSGEKITTFQTKEYNSKKYVDLINNKIESIFLYNHKARFNNDRDIEIFSRLDQGDDSTDSKIADIMPYHSRSNMFKDKYFKLIYDKPCKTITAHMRFDCNMYIHPTQSRGLTPKEAARIQSYPDSYFFKGPYTKTYMQIGNSVPPLMGRGIAESIINKI